MVEPGLDKHEWESWWQQFEEDVETSPAEALSELDRLTARAEDPDAGMPELVGNAGDEGRFRTDHDEVGIECSGEVKEPLAILRVNGVALAEGGDAGVARGGVQLVEARRLAQLPRERMLASARANEEHFHTWTVASAPDGFESDRECEDR